MDAFASQNLSSDFAALTPEGQQQVLRLVQQLRAQQPADAGDQREHRIQKILQLVSGFTPEDIAAFKSAEVECERIDPHGW